MTKTVAQRGRSVVKRAMKSPGTALPLPPAANTDEVALLTDLRALVHAARQRLATAANATYTVLCWQVGRRLLRDELEAGRAAYGKQILATVSQELTTEFGAGFNYTSAP